MQSSLWLKGKDQEWMEFTCKSKTLQGHLILIQIDIYKHQCVCIGTFCFRSPPAHSLQLKHSVNNNPPSSQWNRDQYCIVSSLHLTLCLSVVLCSPWEGLDYLGLSLTIFKRVLEHIVWHSTGSHWHVGHNVEGVVASRLQVINNVASCIISNDNLIFLIVQSWEIKQNKSNQECSQRFFGIAGFAASEHGDLKETERCKAWWKLVLLLWQKGFQIFSETLVLVFSIWPTV